MHKKYSSRTRCMLLNPHALLSTSKMRSSIVLLAAALRISIASAFELPELLSLHRRQAPGTPEYDCHAACGQFLSPFTYFSLLYLYHAADHCVTGSVIQLARTENYCTSSNFTTQLTDCLNCANTFNIWQYYGESVGQAAQACGIAAVPAVANATTSAVISTTGSAASGTATEASSATESAASTTTAAESGSTTVRVLLGQGWRQIAETCLGR